MLSKFAPGRVELLGNHTDYNQGVVLSAALDLGTTISGERTDNGIVTLESEGFGGVELALADGLTKSGQWSDYALGVVAVMRREGFPVDGFTAKVSSNLPVGAGLSSSAALEVATAVFLRDLFELEIDRMGIAKLCRRAENEFVGVNCGLLDHVSSVFGEAGRAVHLDCRDETVRTIAFPDEVDLLIINSGGHHELSGGEYNERREQCIEAAEGLGVSSLREATPQMLRDADLSDLARRRAAHVIGEIERVEAAVDLLGSGDVEGFGQLLSASHRSSMENFENSTPELDQLVEVALLQEGVLGSRLTGGGFGGATVSLVRSENVEAARRAILSEYKSRTGIETVAFRCRIGEGAGATGF
ncbi:MAG: galactokinase [Chthoniobacterales bacterium]